MKRKTSKLLATIMAISTFFTGTMTTQAAELPMSSEIVYEVVLPFDGAETYYETVRMQEPSIRPQIGPNYITVYDFEYTKGSLNYGSWKNGVSGGSNVADMPLTFNYTHDLSFNISFTASVSGEYTAVNKGTIGGNLGVTLGASSSYSLGIGTSVVVPKGQHYTIKYRPAYYTYTVTEIKISEAYILGYGWHRIELGRKTSYVDVFSHWDFTVTR